MIQYYPLLTTNFYKYRKHDIKRKYKCEPDLFQYKMNMLYHIIVSN